MDKNETTKAIANLYQQIVDIQRDIARLIDKLDAMIEERPDE